MEILEQAEQLHKIPLFRTLEASQLKLLAFTSEVSKYSDQDYLFHQDDASDGIYVILEGAVEILMSTDDSTILIATVTSGSMVGEMAVLRGERRSAAVKAKGEVKALKIPNERFLDLISGNSKMALYVLKYVTTQLARTSNELAILRAKIDSE